MPWLLRCTPPGDASRTGGDLFDRFPLLVSSLWDLGSSGVAEQGSSLVAGFVDLDGARRAREAASRHGVAAEVEPVDESWVRREETEVTVQTRSGEISYPVIAGAAFGHGAHPTTRLCLELMSRELMRRWLNPGDRSADRTPTDQRVLDLGTGSGVLAIAAHHLGADHITACDLDASAIESARFNLAANSIDAEIISGGVGEVAASVEKSMLGFDLIIANVLAVVHHAQAAAVTALLDQTGSIVAAGFLDHQTDRVVDSYRGGRATLDVVDTIAIDRWAGVVLADRIAAGTSRSAVTTPTSCQPSPPDVAVRG